MAQERVSASSQTTGQEQDLTGEPGTPAPSGAQEGTQAAAADLDSLLDEIDSVLETNAEEFVKGFVQKGGQ
ncbi:MAG: ubiquitin-like protein Pup [Micrococcus sp.]|nr:ubiquitin-like protein Pup [Micrococcus sp.]